MYVCSKQTGAHNLPCMQTSFNNVTNWLQHCVTMLQQPWRAPSVWYKAHSCGERQAFRSKRERLETVYSSSCWARWLKSSKGFVQSVHLKVKYVKLWKWVEQSTNVYGVVSLSFVLLAGLAACAGYNMWVPLGLRIVCSQQGSLVRNFSYMVAKQFTQIC